MLMLFSTYCVDTFRFIALSNLFQKVVLASLEYLWPLFFNHCVSSCILEILPYLGWFIQYIQFSSVQFSRSVVSDSMNCSTPGLHVHHQPPGFTETHVHRVCDAIQPSHPLSSPSSPAPNPSQHQSLFQ